MDWQRKYAWIPRRVEGRWIWLRWYEERMGYYRPHDVERRS